MSGSCPPAAPPSPRAPFGLQKASLLAGMVPDVVAVWDWEFDRPFLARLERMCAARGLLFAAARDNCEEMLTALASVPDAAPALVLDRASDVVPGLAAPLAVLEGRGCRAVNQAGRMAWCRDKATMHLELVSAGIQVPYGVIITSDQAARASGVLAEHAHSLGAPFVIKPAEGGGGEGVVLDAVSAADLERYLEERGYDKVILQRRVVPCSLGGNRGWFRVFYLAGKTVPCWWDDRTHVYRLVSPAEEEASGLGRLGELTLRIARIAGIDFFTTEIALDLAGEMVVVDFVNEMPDLRCQTDHPDGVPEPLVEAIGAMLVDMAVVGRRPVRSRR
ncbi:MAG TPA: hypothetical protein P5234_14970 [Thermoanaerobaculaceae bacterium]|nr:hypothetical protein [Thermoanaerobaculaceae bacterium]HRS17535.1 hypothetical protein [Thermoanaerobaculaceae bacterium]